MHAENPVYSSYENQTTQFNIYKCMENTLKNILIQSFENWLAKCGSKKIYKAF